MFMILIFENLEKACTFGCARLVLLPSWLMYPNNALQAFVHFLEQLGQFVMQSILEKISSYWLPLQESKSKTWAICTEDQLGVGRDFCIQKCHQQRFLSAYEFLHCCEFFLLKEYYFFFEKKFRKKEKKIWVNFTRILFLAVVDRQTIYFNLERF